MIRLKSLVSGVLKVGQCQAPLITQARDYRKPSPCDVCLFPPEKRPCFDMRTVTIELGNQCHANMIRSFLYTHYWPREPSVAGLWMSLDSPYLDVLTEKYANSGDRLVAFEHMKRTKERRMIGVSVSNKIYPWMPDELEDWAHYTTCAPERNRMYFNAHCYKSPNFFNKFHVKYIYDVYAPTADKSEEEIRAFYADIETLLNYTKKHEVTLVMGDMNAKVEVIATTAEVTGQGVGTKLLKTALDHAEELRHPLVQVVSVSQYTSRICEKCGMKRAWTMDYTDFVDDKGQRVFFPRRPHHTVSIYVKHHDPTKPPPEPCKPPFM